MPDEFIIVNFPETRTVLSGGNQVGSTNQDLVINAGTHTFTLSGAADYDPPAQKVVVYGTSVVTPMQIDFKQLPTLLKPPPPASPSGCPV